MKYALTSWFIGLQDLLKGLGIKAQLELSEEKHCKKVPRLSSSSLSNSLAMFKGMSLIKVSTFLSWS
jgi:hypothetical protein